MSTVHATVQSLLSAPKFPGRDALIEGLPRWFGSRASGPAVVQTRFGFSIEVDPTTDHGMERQIYDWGTYEHGTLHVLRTALRPGDVCVDVGANIGFFSLAASAVVGKTGAIHAFEPFPPTLKLLEENVKRNGFTNVQLHPVALGTEANRLPIYPEDGNRGGTSLHEQAGKPVEIEVRVADEELKELPALRAMKVDVEGWELEVLKGAQAIINQHRPLLIVEFEQARPSAQSLFGWLCDLPNYRIVKLQAGKARVSKLVPVRTASALPEHDNLFCFPEEF